MEDMGFMWDSIEEEVSCPWVKAEEAWSLAFHLGWYTNATYLLRSYKP
jgi:hypothetical protein